MKKYIIEINKNMYIKEILRETDGFSFSITQDRSKAWVFTEERLDTLWPKIQSYFDRKSSVEKVLIEEHN